jgi:hypothetical protein
VPERTVRPVEPSLPSLRFAGPNPDQMELQLKSIEVRYPVARVLLILSVVALLFALAVYRAATAVSGSRDFIYGIAGSVVLGALLIVIGWRIASIAGPVLILGPSGFRDARVIENEIPWEAIQGVRVWHDGGNKYLVLDVDRQAMELIRITRWVRIIGGANGPVSDRGLMIATAGLPIDFDVLFREILARVKAAKGLGTDQDY